MTIRNARRWAPRGLRPWLGAFSAVLIASVLRQSLHPLLGSVMPGSAFCIAAVLIEYYFGLAPALTVMLLGLPIADYLFVPPYGVIDTFDRRDLILLISYPLITLLIIGLIESLRRVQYQAELLTEVARSRYDMLLRADNERAFAERTTDSTHRLLDLLTAGRDNLVLCKTPGTGYQWHTAQRPVGALPGDGIGAFFDSLHPDDRARLAAGATHGPHTLRVRGAPRAVERATATAGADTDTELDEPAQDSGGNALAYVAESFATERGEFIVVRRPDQGLDP